MCNYFRPPPVSKVIQVTQKRLEDGFHTCKCETFFMCILHLNEEKLPVRNNPCCDVEYYEKGWHTFLLLSRVRKPIRYPPDIPHPVESLAWHLYLVFCIQDILHTVAKITFLSKNSNLTNNAKIYFSKQLKNVNKQLNMPTNS